VTIFFLISGFLLYRPFIAHRTGGPPPPRFADFGKRRVLRIFPAYWLCLTVLLVLVPGAIVLDTPNVINQYLLLHTLPIAGEGSCVYRFGSCDLAHTWSLAIEATFYLALPFYVLLSERLAKGRRTASWVRMDLGLLAGLSLACLLARYVVFESSATSTSIVGGTLIGTFLWFALGMGLAVVSVAESAREAPSPGAGFVRRRAGWLWVAAFAVYAAITEYLPDTTFVFDVSDQVLTFIGFGTAALLLLLPAVFSSREEGRPQRFLSNPAVAWFGLISYGVFLWHNPVIIELSRRHGEMSFVPLVLAALAITTVIAAASYYLLERPVMRFKYRPLLTAPRRPAAPRG